MLTLERFTLVRNSCTRCAGPGSLTLNGVLSSMTLRASLADTSSFISCKHGLKAALMAFGEYGACEIVAFKMSYLEFELVN